MIGLENELLIRTGPIMKKRMMKSMFTRKDSGVKRFNKKSKEKSTTPKEQRIRIGSEI